MPCFERSLSSSIDYLLFASRKEPASARSVKNSSLRKRRLWQPSGCTSNRCARKISVPERAAVSEMRRVGLESLQMKLGGASPRLAAQPHVELCVAGGRVRDVNLQFLLLALAGHGQREAVDRLFLIRAPPGLLNGFQVLT